MSYPPIKNGTRVRAIPRQANDRLYKGEAIRARDTHAGEIGVVCEHHDSHGLCYGVNFEGVVAFFEPEELEVFEGTPAVKPSWRVT